MTRAPEPPLDPLGESESRADADALRAAHARDAAIVLPVLGLLLFSPPLITLFASDAPVFGAPFIVVYLFAAWATTPKTWFKYSSHVSVLILPVGFSMVTDDPIGVG